MSLRGCWKHKDVYGEGRLLSAVAERTRQFGDCKFSKEMSLDDMVNDLQQVRGTMKDVKVVLAYSFLEGEQEHPNASAAIQAINEFKAKCAKDSTAAGCAAEWSAEIYKQEKYGECSCFCESWEENRFDIVKETTVNNSVVKRQTVVWGLKRLMIAEKVYVLVAFRGTSDLMDWAANLMCELNKDVPCFREKQVFVHSGFWAKVEECKNDIRLAIKDLDEKKLKNTEWELLITGHSQGGGLAKLFFSYLKVLTEEKKDEWKTVLYRGDGSERKISCIAFAGPSVLGWEQSLVNEAQIHALSQTMHGNMVNYVFQNDPVPRFYAWPDIIPFLEGLGIRCAKGSRALVSSNNRSPKILNFMLKAVGMRAIIFASGLVGVITGDMEYMAAARALASFSDQIRDVINVVFKDGMKYQNINKVIHIRKTQQDNRSYSDWLKSFTCRAANLSDHSMADGYLAALRHPEAFQRKDFDGDKVASGGDSGSQAAEESFIDPTAAMLTDALAEDPMCEAMEASDMSDIAEGCMLLSGYRLLGHEVKKHAEEFQKEDTQQSGLLEFMRRKAEEAPDQKSFRRRELQHEFLDAAKFGSSDSFKNMFLMLEQSEQHRREVAGRPLGDHQEGEQEKKRWSAAMQLIYQQADMKDFIKLLQFYPSPEDIQKIQTDGDLLEVVEKQQSERGVAGSGRAVAEDARPAASGGGRFPVTGKENSATVPKIEDLLEKFANDLKVHPEKNFKDVLEDYI